MSTFFISDLHLGDNQIIEFGTRPDFGKTPQEHDAILLDRINSTVNKRDKLFILGDVAFSNTGIETFKQINCQNIEIIWGNHDPIDKLLPYTQKFHGFCKYKNDFWLSHCPIHPAELRGKKNIHGHVHHNVLNDPNYISVCVEACNGYPIDFQEILLRSMP